MVDHPRPKPLVHTLSFMRVNASSLKSRRAASRVLCSDQYSVHIQWRWYLSHRAISAPFNSTRRASKFHSARWASKKKHVVPESYHGRGALSWPKLVSSTSRSVKQNDNHIDILWCLPARGSPHTQTQLRFNCTGPCARLSVI